eukprot:TRINITY_DN1111_c0_g1_i1.p1 TRINITY_DN1111_c0_g1~~TRINITY_DN1111_c0_g1_i1.p1  ORF type:complete len:1513 (-),score=544.04 TRINITY_DN1111_c0_g1_i1:195-4223(-)
MEHYVRKDEMQTNMEDMESALKQEYEQSKNPSLPSDDAFVSLRRYEEDQQHIVDALRSKIDADQITESRFVSEHDMLTKLREKADVSSLRECEKEIQSAMDMISSAPCRGDLDDIVISIEDMRKRTESFAKMERDIQQLDENIKKCKEDLSQRASSSDMRRVAQRLDSMNLNLVEKDRYDRKVMELERQIGSKFGPQNLDIRKFVERDEVNAMLHRDLTAQSEALMKRIQSEMANLASSIETNVVQNLRKKADGSDLEKLTRKVEEARELIMQIVQDIRACDAKVEEVALVKANTDDVISLGKAMDQLSDVSIDKKRFEENMRRIDEMMKKKVDVADLENMGFVDEVSFANAMRGKVDSTQQRETDERVHAIEDIVVDLATRKDMESISASLKDLHRQFDASQTLMEGFEEDIRRTNEGLREKSNVADFRRLVEKINFLESISSEYDKIEKRIVDLERDLGTKYGAADVDLGEFLSKVDFERQMRVQLSSLHDNLIKKMGSNLHEFEEALEEATSKTMKRKVDVADVQRIRGQIEEQNVQMTKWGSSIRQLDEQFNELMNLKADKGATIGLGQEIERIRSQMIDRTRYEEELRVVMDAIHAKVDTDRLASMRFVTERDLQTKLSEKVDVDAMTSIGRDMQETRGIVAKLPSREEIEHVNSVLVELRRRVETLCELETSTSRLEDQVRGMREEGSVRSTMLSDVRRLSQRIDGMQSHFVERERFDRKISDLERDVNGKMNASDIDLSIFVSRDEMMGTIEQSVRARIDPLQQQTAKLVEGVSSSLEREVDEKVKAKANAREVAELQAAFRETFQAVEKLSSSVRSIDVQVNELDAKKGDAAAFSTLSQSFSRLQSEAVGKAQFDEDMRSLNENLRSKVDAKMFEKLRFVTEDYLQSRMRDVVEKGAITGLQRDVHHLMETFPSLIMRDDMDLVLRNMATIQQNVEDLRSLRAPVVRMGEIVDAIGEELRSKCSSDDFKRLSQRVDMVQDSSLERDRVDRRFSAVERLLNKKISRDDVDFTTFVRHDELVNLVSPLITSRGAEEVDLLRGEIERSTQHKDEEIMSAMERLTSGLVSVEKSMSVLRGDRERILDQVEAISQEMLTKAEAAKMERTSTDEMSRAVDEVRKEMSEMLVLHRQNVMEELQQSISRHESEFEEIRKFICQLSDTVLSAATNIDKEQFVQRDDFEREMLVFRQRLDHPEGEIHGETKSTGLRVIEDEEFRGRLRADVDILRSQMEQELRRFSSALTVIKDLEDVIRSGKIDHQSISTIFVQMRSEMEEFNRKKADSAELRRLEILLKQKMDRAEFAGEMEKRDKHLRESYRPLVQGMHDLKKSQGGRSKP